MMETLTPIKQDTPNSTSPTPPPALVRKVDSVSATECANCGTTTTPLWRRGPNGETICNACGLYLKARNTLRPPTLKRTVHKKVASPTEQKNDCGGGTCPGGGQCNGTGGSTSCAGCPAFNQHQVNRQALICANCRTTTTPLWRRDEQGNTICNACGLYYKLHNVHRPVSMKRSVIKRRKRIIVAQGSDEEEPEDDEDNFSQTSHISTPQSSQPPLPANVTTTSATPANITNPQKTTHPVPEIEDYVVLKKKKLMELPKKKQPHYLLSSPMAPPPLPHRSSTPTPPPSSQSYTPVASNAVATSPSAPVSLSDKIYHQPQTFHPSYQLQHSQSPQAQAPPPQQQQNHSPLFSKPYPENPPTASKSFLPPISSERQSYRLESLFGRRDSASSASSSVNTNNTLPPLSLPPLTPPSSQTQQYPNHQQRSMSPMQLSHKQQQQLQQPSPPQAHQIAPQPQLLQHPPPSQLQRQNNNYELADFDQALDRLEHLRRQVRPEQSYALSQLTQSLSDLASKAEAILSLDSLAYGR
ncbi:hypothetical protein BD408DRAFT_418776 [Parasitella parasitica]|nr:hypothetical protein BD408DRAFT_418776 [Parasitella parasitica]